MLAPSSSLEDFFDRWGSIAFLERSIVAGQTGIGDSWLSLFPRVETLKAFWNEAKAFVGGDLRSPMGVLPTVCSMARQIVDDDSFALVGLGLSVDSHIRVGVEEILDAARESYQSPDPSSFAYLVHDALPNGDVWTSIPQDARSDRTVRQCVLSGWVNRARWASRLDGNFIVGLSAKGDWLSGPPVTDTEIAILAAEAPDLFRGSLQVDFTDSNGPADVEATDTATVFQRERQVG